MRWWCTPTVRARRTPDTLDRHPGNYMREQSKQDYFQRTPAEVKPAAGGAGQQRHGLGLKSSPARCKTQARSGGGVKTLGKGLGAVGVAAGQPGWHQVDHRPIIPFSNGCLIQATASPDVVVEEATLSGGAATPSLRIREADLEHHLSNPNGDRESKPEARNRTKQETRRKPRDDKSKGRQQDRPANPRATPT